MPSQSKDPKYMGADDEGNWVTRSGDALWGGAKDLWGGFTDWMSGGGAYDWQNRPERGEYIDQARAMDAQSRSFQEALAAKYEDAIAGKSPSIAENQLRETTAQNQQQQMSMARSGTGPLGGAGAQYEAARNAAQINQMANREAATLRAQEHQANMQGAAGLYGDMRVADQSRLGTETDYEAALAGAFTDKEAAKAKAYEDSAKRKQAGGIPSAIGNAFGGIF